MLKRLLVTAAFVVAAGSMVGVSTVDAKDDKAPKPEKVTICHRTASYSNPYVSIKVAQASVDGNAGNDNGQGDHYLEHTGPVFYAGIPKHTEWGDIIPPIAGVHAGLNWTEEGQAIYENNCNVPTIKFDVVCDVVNHKAVITFTNTGKKTYKKVTVNGEQVLVEPGIDTVVEVPTAVGGTQITIVINKVTVYDQLVTCEPGKGAGGETPVTPATPAAATPAASLPFTGDNTPVVALIASAVATVTAIVSVIVKSALVKQL